MDKKYRFSIWYFLLAFWLIIMLQELYFASQHLDEVPYSQFKSWVVEGQVAEIAISDTKINGKLKPETEGAEPHWFQTIRVDDPDLVRLLEESDVEFAKRMVKDYGMSEKLGRVALEMAAQPAYLKPNEMSRDGNYSEQTAREIDQEVKQLIQTQETRVKELLATLKPALLCGAKRLLAQEVMTGTELQALLKEQKGDQVSSQT